MRRVNDEIAKLIDAPGTSNWLREALLTALQRDPMTAANDAQQLAQVLTGRVEAMFFLEHWQRPHDADDASVPTLADRVLPGHRNSERDPG